MSAPSKPYPQVDANPDFPRIEEAVLASWKKEGTFAASIDARDAAKSGKNNEFIFYDGPPFANGLPHYGHLLTGFVKDLFARYQTMRGKRVERRFGWDCHGLPAEMGAEKELGISGHQAITKFGIGKFNDYCRSSVMKYTAEWEDYVTRQARWVDFKNDYKTMDTNFMESVIWAFSELHKKGLVYEAYRVMPYSWAAETPLSTFETRLDNSTRERVDKAIYVTFELKEAPKGAPPADKYHVIAWTTTPWTLPSNLALAANKDIEYVCIVKDGMGYICSPGAAEKLKTELGQKAEKGHTLTEGDNLFTLPKGALLGLSYKALFPYFYEERYPFHKDHPKAFRILDGSSFVTDADGTGVVHMAPGFGEDDQKVCEANGIEIVCPVDRAGRFTAEIYDLPDLQLKGLNVIEENVEKFKFGEANERIINWLKQHGHLIKQEQIKHNYPHCWRTDKPLIYRAVPSWYVEVTKFRGRAVELNKQINWIPEHIRDGQMGHMLATAPDWSISRNRFWGTPIPIWRSDNPANKKLYVFGSIAELEKFFGKKVPDLHRPFIDELTAPDPEDSKYTLRRVEDVFDCWFESGSMPFAQVHYPFENKEWFESHFPADFITEYVGQTRGWFNTLIMLATALFDKPPFKNCICHGVVLDSETGLKYSKRLKNYKDPMEVMDKFGADALRWLMISSPVMRGQDLSVDPDGKFIRDVVRLAIKPIWNAYNFFCLYANADNLKAEFNANSKDVMDRYILAKCKVAVNAMEKALDAYDTPGATDAVMHFFETLNNWYIRRNKERFWREEKDADKQAAYNTLYTVLVVMCRASAPLLPLIAEQIHEGLTQGKSVHLADWPDVKTFPEDEKLLFLMDMVQDICNAAHAVRNRLNIRVRQPLANLQVVGGAATQIGLNPQFGIEDIIKDEVNVKNITALEAKDIVNYADYKPQINFAVLGKRLPEKIKHIIPAAKNGEWNAVNGKIEIAGALLEKNEFTILLEPKAAVKDRAQPLSTNDALVILDTHITPALEQEGYARDLIRLIQQARKEAGLHVTDRIHLRLRLSANMSAMLTVHKDYIAGEVLAESVQESDMQGCSFIANETIEGEEVSIGFASKAAAA